MFTIGKSLISLYIGSSYGAAGSLIVVHLWIFYSAQIFLIGAEFTKVYADHYGSRVRQRPRSGPLIGDRDHDPYFVAGRRVAARSPIFRP